MPSLPAYENSVILPYIITYSTIYSNLFGLDKTPSVKHNCFFFFVLLQSHAKLRSCLREHKLT